MPKVGIRADIRTIVGTEPQLDDTDKLAVSLYGGESAVGDTGLLATALGYLGAAIGATSVTADGTFTGTSIYQGGGSARILAAAMMGADGSGTTWSRYRLNNEQTILASAARTSTTNGADQTNWNYSGLVLVVNVTARAVATTLTPSIQLKDPVSGEYKTIWTAAAPINTADDTICYLFTPGGAAGSYTEAVNLRLPYTWRAVITHGDGDSITYSVGAINLL